MQRDLSVISSDALDICSDTFGRSPFIEPAPEHLCDALSLIDTSNELK